MIIKPYYCHLQNIRCKLTKYIKNLRFIIKTIHILNPHFTECNIFPDKNFSFKFSLFMMISKGIIFNIPLVLKIFSLRLLIYGLQRTINTPKLKITMTAYFILSMFNTLSKKSSIAKPIFITRACKGASRASKIFSKSESRQLGYINSILFRRLPDDINLELPKAADWALELVVGLVISPT